MRTMRMWLAGVVILALLGGLGAAVAAQDEEPLDPMGASPWTATFTELVPPDFASAFTPGSDYDEMYGVATEGLVEEASGPRISGQLRMVVNHRSYPGREFDGQSVDVWSATSRIDNDDGAWVGTATGLLGDGGLARESSVLHGEGAYEGLTAVFRWQSEGSMLEGVIFRGDLPPMPDPIEPPVE